MKTSLVRPLVAAEIIYGGGDGLGQPLSNNDHLNNKKLQHNGNMITHPILQNKTEIHEPFLMHQNQLNHCWCLILLFNNYTGMTLSILGSRQKRSFEG